jgi:hypothetical protein
MLSTTLSPGIKFFSLGIHTLVVGLRDTNIVGLGTHTLFTYNLPFGLITQVTVYSGETSGLNCGGRWK